MLVTTGFSSQAERQINLWDIRRPELFVILVCQYRHNGV